MTDYRTLLSELRDKLRYTINFLQFHEHIDCPVYFVLGQDPLGVMPEFQYKVFIGGRGLSAKRSPAVFPFHHKRLSSSRDLAFA